MKLRFFRAILLVYLGASLFCTTIVFVQAAMVRTISDSSTVIPGGTGTFRRFETPVYHAAQIAFVGTGGSNQTGIYLWEDGRLSVVADRNIPVPGTAERFRQFDRPTVENGTVWFAATTGAGTNIQSGLYQWRDGKLSVIADQNTSVPAGRGRFLLFYAPFARSGRLVFVGAGDGSTDMNNPEVGLFLYAGEELRKLVDGDDFVPGKSVRFFDFNREEAAFDFDGQQVAFLGGYGQFTGPVTGIVCSVTISGQLRALADGPDYSFDFVSGRPRLDRDGVVVNATDNSTLKRAIILHQNGSLSPLIRESENVPGIGPLFLYGQLDLARHGRRVIFRGCAGNAEGLYCIDDGTGDAIVRAGVPFGGAKFPLESSMELFDGRGFDGRHVAFKVRYTDLSEAIFLADLGLAPGEVAIDRGEFTSSGFKLELVHNGINACRVEYVNQMSSSPAWQILQTIPSPTPQFQFTDSSAAASKTRFYRVVPE